MIAPFALQGEEYYAGPLELEGRTQGTAPCFQSG